MNKLYIITEYQSGNTTYTNNIDDVASLSGLSTSFINKLQIGEELFVKNNDIAYIVEVTKSVADLMKLKSTGLYR
jgi:hypothetical protein